MPKYAYKEHLLNYYTDDWYSELPKKETLMNRSLLDSIFKDTLQRRMTNLDTADVQFRRVTNRYAHKGTFSSNKGYLKVGRDSSTGKFVSPYSS